MKLLNRLRELREEQVTPQDDAVAPDEHSLYAFEFTNKSNDDLANTMGVGTTMIDDIIRLNVEHRNLQISLFAMA